MTHSQVCRYLDSQKLLHSHSQILCNETTPIKIGYDTKSEYAKFHLEYTNRMWKENTNGEKYLGFVKPAYEARRNQRSADLKKKRQCTEESLFLDHSNVIQETDQEEAVVEQLSEKRVQKKKKLDGQLCLGERVQIFWGLDVADEEGWYRGTIIGYPSDEEEKKNGDHFVLYDDEKKRGNLEPIIERLFENENSKAEIWKLF